MTRAKLLKLPIGIQTFEKLREGGYLYVDKTKYLIDMIDGGNVYFLSRPRRFGKSLTVSTFDALFSGKRELFKGLYAEEFFERAGYRTHPVVRIDMSQVVTESDLDEMRMSMYSQVLDNAYRNDVVIPEYAAGSPAVGLKELLRLAAQKHGPVVVLVDEYDKPILDAINDPARAEKYRGSLRSFYTQIKAEDEHIKFVFMTGITKFTRTGVFSAMNNLSDISIDDRYSEMLGLTEAELLLHFKERIAIAAQKFNISDERLMELVGSYYDGFSFDGVRRVYNPFSTLNFFDKCAFNNYWFESGQASFISNYIRTHQLSVEEFRGMEVYDTFASVHEIERASPESFLFQAGYLTIRETRMNEDMSLSYVLDYPNREVLKSVSRLFAEDICGVGSGLLGVHREFIAAFDSGDIAGVMEILNRLIASIPYNLFANEEKYYHSVIYSMMASAGIDARAEDRSKAGSADIVVHRKGRYYVIEVKTAPDEAHCEKASGDAIAQIEKRGYHKKFPPESTTLIGVAIGLAGRKIGHYRVVAAQRS